MEQIDKPGSPGNSNQSGDASSSPSNPFSRRSFLHSIGLGAAAFGLQQIGCVLVKQSTQLFKAEIVKELNIEGRKVVRYEYESVSQWKYEKPQRDYFYLFYPRHPQTESVPLHVILHSAGGSGESEMLLTSKRPYSIHAYTDESSYGLYLDCSNNQNTDFWWGYNSIKKNPELYTDQLTPTERRMLATIDWVKFFFNVDSNRIYLSGVSMGGSGSLGIGFCRGDIFAAISVAVPAGIDHALLRMTNRQHPEPPPVFDFSSQNDNWAKGQEKLIDYCKKNRYFFGFAWGAGGHMTDISQFSSAAFEFPWRFIRKNEAYPVFINASSDNSYPGFQNITAPDQRGQINGYFRWKNIMDKPDRFTMELRLVKKNELKKPEEVPTASISDITLRRLQQFNVRQGATYKWRIVSDGKSLQSGDIQADSENLLTIPKVKIQDQPAQLELKLKK